MEIMMMFHTRIIHRKSVDRIVAVSRGIGTLYALPECDVSHAVGCSADQEMVETDSGVRRYGECFAKHASDAAASDVGRKCNPRSDQLVFSVKHDERCVLLATRHEGPVLSVAFDIAFVVGIIRSIAYCKDAVLY